MRYEVGKAAMHTLRQGLLLPAPTLLVEAVDAEL